MRMHGPSAVPKNHSYNTPSCATMPNTTRRRSPSHIPHRSSYSRRQRTAANSRGCALCILADVLQRESVTAVRIQRPAEPTDRTEYKVQRHHDTQNTETCIPHLPVLASTCPPYRPSLCAAGLQGASACNACRARTVACSLCAPVGTYRHGKGTAARHRARD